MGYDYDAAHIEALLTRCREVGAWTSPAFWKAEPETLRRYYNGIGPDAWSSRFRSLVTRLLEPFEISAFPHDFEFATAARTRFAFTLSNIRFAVNAILEAAYRHPLHFPLKREHRAELCRFLVMSGCGLLLALLCQLFGWQGYKNTKIEV